MRQLYLNRAIAEAVQKEMAYDENVLLIGEDIINKGGGMSIFMGVAGAFPERSFDMPIAESGFTHFANGAAMAGFRCIVDLMFSDFSTLSYDAIINGAAKFRFNSLGELAIANTYIMANGGRGLYPNTVGSGCNHSQSVQSWYMNCPGLKIVAPYYPSDTLGLLRASIRDNDPVVFLYHEGSLGIREEVTEEDFIIPLTNAAKIMQEGTDITMVALQGAIPLAVKAVEELTAAGVSVELIDPRVLIPLDTDKIVKSVKKTNKLMIVTDEHSRGCFGAEIISAVAQQCVGSIKDFKLVGALNAPIGSGFTEVLIMPSVEGIVSTAKGMCK